MRLLSLLVPFALIAACSADPEPDAAPASSSAPPAVSAPATMPLNPDGSPLGPPPESEPGPDVVKPTCEDFAKNATCTTVGAVRWVLTTSGTGWTLTEYDYGDDFWVPGLVARGQGTPPRVTAVDLSPDDQPESVVSYGDSFDIVSTGDAGVPEVVAHVQGQPQVSERGVTVGGKQVRQEPGGAWVLAG